MKRIEEILADCLDDIETGKASFEECLERYSEVSDELGPLLKLALNIEDLPVIEPSAAFRLRTRAGLVNHMNTHPLKHSSMSWMTKIINQPSWVRVGAMLLAFLVVVTGIGAGTTYAAQSSLPGDTLYPVKTGSESLRSWIETDAAADTSLQLEFADRRIEEIECLTGKSDSNIPIAVAGYKNNIEKALMYAQSTIGSAAREDIINITENHINRLDLCEDTADGMSQSGLAEAERIAVTGQVNSIRYLSENEPYRASQMTITAMQNRLIRASEAILVGNTVCAENAIRNCIRYAGLGEEILDEYEGTEVGTGLRELYGQDRQTQQRLFASYSNRISSQLAGEMHAAFRNMERHRNRELVNQGQGLGNQEQKPELDNQGQKQSDQGQGSASQGQEPDNQGQGQDNQEQEPGDEWPDSGSQGQGNSSSGGNGSGGSNNSGSGSGSDGQQGK